MREHHVRFCERLGVRLPWSTLLITHRPFYTLSPSLQKNNGTDLFSTDKPGVEMNVSFWMKADVHRKSAKVSFISNLPFSSTGMDCGGKHCTTD
jgi:hypothetical protein